jgi:hypothetical protein
MAVKRMGMFGVSMWKIKASTLKEKCTKLVKLFFFTSFGDLSYIWINVFSLGIHVSFVGSS